MKLSESDRISMALRAWDEGVKRGMTNGISHSDFMRYWLTAPEDELVAMMERNKNKVLQNTKLARIINSPAGKALSKKFGAK
jgi:hypothetical protein